MLKPLTSLALSSLLSIGALSAAQAAEPAGAAAVFLNQGQAIALRNGSASVYQDARGQVRAADPVCVQKRGGRVLRNAQPPACPAGSSLGYVDRASGRLASKDHGLSEFTQYRLARSIPAPTLNFQLHGQPHTAVIVVQDAGGSGSFYSLGVASGAGKTQQGSELVALGDRILPYWMEFDAQHGVLSVSYLDRADGTPMVAEPTVRKHRRFRIEGRQLVELR